MVPVRSLRSPDAACGGAAEPGVRPLFQLYRVNIKPDYNDFAYAVSRVKAI